MSLLLSPTTTAKLELKNHIVMSPMCLFAVEKHDGIASEVHFAHYGARAIGQIGLIIIEANAVAPNGRITPDDLGLWSDEQAEVFGRLVRFTQSLGAKVGVQINHAGRKAEDTPELPWAPSPVPVAPDAPAPHEMTIDEINQVQDQFVAAIQRAVNAGVDMIEIHGAHGYLIDQFLSPFTNRRTDEYGGTLEKRYRFVQEIIARVRAFYSGSLWIRLSLTDYLPADQQNSIEDWQQVGRWLERDGIDCIDCSTGGLIDAVPNFPITQGYQVPYAMKMKEALDVPIATVGLLDNPGLCEFILKNGFADLVLQGRELLRDPNWPATAALALHDHDFKVYNSAYYRGQTQEFHEMCPNGYFKNGESRA